MVSRLRELLQLTGKFALGEGLMGIVLNGYGAFVLIGDSKNSGWFWLFLGTALIAVSLLSVAYSALRARDEARDERDEVAAQPRVKAAVYSEGKDGGIGNIGPVHGEYRDSSSS